MRHFTLALLLNLLFALPFARATEPAAATLRQECYDKLYTLLTRDHLQLEPALSVAFNQEYNFSNNFWICSFVANTPKARALEEALKITINTSNISYYTAEQKNMTLINKNDHARMTENCLDNINAFSLLGMFKSKNIKKEKKERASFCNSFIATNIQPSENQFNFRYNRKVITSLRIIDGIDSLLAGFKAKEEERSFIQQLEVVSPAQPILAIKPIPSDTTAPVLQSLPVISDSTAAPADSTANHVENHAVIHTFDDEQPSE